MQVRLIKDPSKEARVANSPGVCSLEGAFWLTENLVEM